MCKLIVAICSKYILGDLFWHKTKNISIYDHAKIKEAKVKKTDLQALGSMKLCTMTFATHNLTITRSTIALNCEMSLTGIYYIQLFGINTINYIFKTVLFVNLAQNYK